MMNFQRALSSMGYRPLKSDYSIWAKPVGYHLFLYDIEANQFMNCIKGNKGKVLTWSSDSFNGEPEDFLLWLKNTECYSYTQHDEISSFEFLSLRGLVEPLL